MMTKRKTISIIGTAGLPANYGGFETLAENLTANLKEKFNFIVYCSKKNYQDFKTHHNGAKLEYINLKANGIESIAYDIVSILRSINRSDVILILGVSGSIILPIVRILFKKKIIVNIDGLEWKREKWGIIARLFLKYSEFLAIKNSSVVISDNNGIYEYVKKEYNKESNLIAYGGDYDLDKSLSIKSAFDLQFSSKSYALTVCRIEPENNIHQILQAFANNSSLDLVCVGNWSKSDYGRKLKSKFSAIRNIKLLEPIYDMSTITWVRSNCKFYIHGHSAGGTNPSLVEAMWLGIPILAYDVNYNRSTTDNKAIFFKNQKELEKILLKINETDLEDIGLKLKKVAKIRYSWKVICSQYEDIFNS